MKAKTYVNVIPLTKTRRSNSTANSRAFTYVVEQEHTERGQEVRMPFGGRDARGIITETIKKPGIPVSKILQAKEGKAPYKLSETAFKLAKWITEEEICSLGQALELFLPPSKTSRTKERKGKQFPILSVPVLTQEQQEALKVARQNFSLLLWGVTGSGKTEVYFRRVAEVLAKNSKSQVLVLVPEIGMVPQMLERLSERFGVERIATIHSKLSAGERTDALAAVADNKKRIILGTRSAIFAPFQNLKLIVMDECHDPSYVSWDMSPRYDGRDVAEKLAELTKAQIIFGSATPHVELVNRCLNKREEYGRGLSDRIPIRSRTASSVSRAFQDIDCVRMQKRIHQEEFPLVRVVDMRTEFRDHKNPTSLSWDLQEALKETVAANKQAILFVNRRGAATAILCKCCGWKAMCETCDIPLTHHLAKAKDIGRENVLMCHHCNHHETPPAVCPECKDPSVRFLGSGTERVELDLKKLLPDSRIARMDTDSTARKHAHEELFDAIKHHEIDVLVGTQIVTKGLDLPNVDLIGVVNADTLLHLPDIRSHERTFQLLTQVVGRTGRRDNPGRVVLQTYEPDNSVIQAVAQHNADAFFRHELEERKEWNYPPFSLLVRFLVEEKDPAKAVEIANDAARQLRTALGSQKNIEILGPAPAFHARSKGKTRIHILLKAPQKNKKEIWKIIRKLPEIVRIDVNPESTL